MINHKVQHHKTCFCICWLGSYLERRHRFIHQQAVLHTACAGCCVGIVKILSWNITYWSRGIELKESRFTKNVYFHTKSELHK